MSRQRKGWLLMLAVSLWVTPNILSLAFRTTAKSCCASVACCAGKSCPMRSRSAEPAMPKGCRMSHTKQDSGSTMTCTCSVSSTDSSFNLTSHFDFRFDLPRSGSAHQNTSSLRRASSSTAAASVGFTSPLDQPPEINS